jgi:hypothetical protein
VKRELLEQMVVVDHMEQQDIQGHRVHRDFMEQQDIQVIQVL